MKLCFVTKNLGKFKEVQDLLKSYVEVVQTKVKVTEIRSGNLKEVARAKAKEAYRLVGKPLIVEDSGLFIHALNGFPGVVSSEVFKGIGNEGILKLMKGVKDRRAEFRSTIAYCDGKKLRVFLGSKHGVIANQKKGKFGFGFDPIFIPQGEERTFAQMKLKEKNAISHRAQAVKKFIRWLQGYKLRTSKIS